MRIKRIWEMILYHYRWFKYGDPSPVLVDQRKSPEVINTKFKISVLFHDYMKDNLMRVLCISLLKNYWNKYF